MRSGVTDDPTAAWGTWQTRATERCGWWCALYKTPRSFFLPPGPALQATMRSKGSFRAPFTPRGLQD